MDGRSNGSEGIIYYPATFCVAGIKSGDIIFSIINLWEKSLALKGE